MKKQELKKLAILGVASGLLMSAQVQANEIKEETKDGALNVGTLLAAGCGGGNCGHRNYAPQGSYAPGPSYYNQQPQEIYYQNQIPGQFYPAPQQAYQPNPNQTYQQSQQDPYSQSYNPYNQQPSQQELQRQYQQQQQQKQTQNQNRQSQDQWESNNRNLQFRDNTADSERNKSNWDSYSTSTSDRPTKQITESEFLSGLNNQSKEIFKGLDSEGKRLAIQFASQGTDKNEAVKMAQKKMADKRSNFDR